VPTEHVRGGSCDRRSSLHAWARSQFDFACAEHLVDDVDQRAPSTDTRARAPIGKSDRTVAADVPQRQVPQVAQMTVHRRDVTSNARFAQSGNRRVPTPEGAARLRRPFF